MSESKSRNGLRWLFSLLLAGVFYSLLNIVLHRSIFLSVLGAIVGLIIGLIVFKPRKSRIKVDGTSGITEKMLEDALKEGRAKKKTIDDLLRKIRDTEVRETGRNVSKLIGKILDDIESDPKDLKPAKRFLSYYLDSTVRILTQAMDFSLQKTESKTAEESLVKIRDMLKKMEIAFQNQLEKLMEDDVLNLDTEIAVLESTIKMEGLDGGK